jgi:carbonic anhydrase
MLQELESANKCANTGTLVSVAAQYTPIRHLSLHSLLPETQHYMTYEGSTTHPGCWETTVWIILNKPIYITKQEVTPHRTVTVS